MLAARTSLARKCGTTGEHFRRIAVRDVRDRREWRDTQNQGLHVVSVSLGVPVTCLRRWRIFSKHPVKAYSIIVAT